MRSRKGHIDAISALRDRVAQVDPESSPTRSPEVGRGDYHPRLRWSAGCPPEQRRSKSATGQRDHHIKWPAEGQHYADPPGLLFSFQQAPRTFEIPARVPRVGWLLRTGCRRRGRERPR